MDVGAWLEERGFGQYAAAFASNDVDADVLRTLTADDLKELGVASLGHRKKLLAAIAGLGAANDAPPSPEIRTPRHLALRILRSRDALEGERKQVTILFADLKGSLALAAGDQAPDFDLPTDGGGRVRLADLAGRPLVLYFYPKDDTPGCTTEAQGFAEAHPAFAAAGVALIGVSKDDVASHERFKAKYGLPFALAADETGATVEAYGSWVEKSMYGKSYMGIDRSTFLIDGGGTVRRVWRKVKVPGHVEEVLAAAKELATA